MGAPAERIVATILGCGSSGGVPRVGNNWGDCDPNNPKNRRLRCCMLLTGTRADSDTPTHVLIDTGADLREQLLANNVKDINAVVYTHEHADHTHGIDDLRALVISRKQRIPVYMPDRMKPRMQEAFGYCFKTPPGSDYPPILDMHSFNAGETKSYDGPGGSIEIEAFPLVHGDIEALGFRVGGMAYTPDVSDIPDTSFEALSGLDVWVIDALRRKPHPSHFSLSESLDWIERLQPKSAVLTNLHIDLDHDVVGRETPDHVTPAHDGLQIDVTAGQIL